MSFDHREFASFCGGLFQSIDTKTMKAVLFDGTECSIVFEVCHTCEGKGHYVNPAIDANGITMEEWHEYGEEFQDDYLSGVYDVRCEACKGKRVIPVVDPDDEEASQLVDDFYRNAEEDYAMHRAECWYMYQ